MRFPLDYVDTGFVTGRSLEGDPVLASILVSHRNLNRFASVVQVDEFDESARFLCNRHNFLVSVVRNPTRERNGDARNE